ncbi:hypothetical protein C8035_v000829 [Colletotrichum spinosum]|uniref:Uncharacterized protein n=1 Tax=Colletotrichum spinosum TaxID=1347390 RepID=A0A4R8Q134_9PEZI|nr:hypothetical protein C8035_v000829 [Colletotrichum spinosum]
MIHQPERGGGIWLLTDSSTTTLLVTAYQHKTLGIFGQRTPDMASSPRTCCVPRADESSTSPLPQAAHRVPWIRVVNASLAQAACATPRSSAPIATGGMSRVAPPPMKRSIQNPVLYP